MTKPTADQCIMEIYDLINADFEENGYCGEKMPIPVRTYTLVRDGVLNAFRKAYEESHTTQAKVEA